MVVMVSVMGLETYIVIYSNGKKGSASRICVVVVVVCVGGPITISLPGSIDGVIGFPSSSILTTVNPIKLSSMKALHSSVIIEALSSTSRDSFGPSLLTTPSLIASVRIKG